jgi:hypothetical protein
LDTSNVAAESNTLSLVLTDLLDKQLFASESLVVDEELLRQHSAGIPTSHSARAWYQLGLEKAVSA